LIDIILSLFEKMKKSVEENKNEYEKQQLANEMNRINQIKSKGCKEVSRFLYSLLVSKMIASEKKL